MIKKENIITSIKSNWFFLLISALVMIPIIIYASVSLPAADDFRNACDMAQAIQKYHNPLSASIATTVQLYRNTSGYFFSAFLNFFFSPFLYFGVSGLRIFNIAANIIFFCTLFYFIKSFTKAVIGSDGRIVWMIFSIMIAALVNCFMNSEIYTWYCVLVAYVLPISLMLTAFGSYIKYLSGNKKHFFLVAIAAFLVSGSSLNVTALNCLIFLILCFYGFVYAKKKKESVIIFAASFAGALVNVIAPGNYIRHDSINVSYGIISALKETVKYSAGTLLNRFTSPLFLAVIIVVFLLALTQVDLNKLGLKFNSVILVSAGMLFGILIVNFPVIFGYGTGYFPDRCVFVEDIALFILTMFWTVYLAGYLQKKHGTIVLDKCSKIVVTISLCLTLLTYIGIHGSLSSFSTGYMMKSIASGSLMNCVNFEEQIMNEMENSKEKDLVIYVSHWPEDYFLQSIGITEDPTNWVNLSMASYYQLDSVKFVKTE